MILEKVTERTYANTTGEARGNFGAIRFPKYAVAIDAGMYPAVAKRFRSYIERETKVPVKKLILTHYHGDHVFGSQIFRDCQIISSCVLATQMIEAAQNQWKIEKLKESAKMRPESYGKLNLDKLKITFPTEIFEETMLLTDDEFKIVIKRVGGHTAGSTYAYFPMEQVLFVGDLIFSKMFPWGGDPTVDPDEWIAALKEFLQMDVQKIVPGHGPLCDLTEVQTYLDFIEQTTKIMKELILEGRTREEVVNFNGYPEFYTPEAVDRRIDTFERWHEIYEMKHEKTNNDSSRSIK
jgi:glyoxylase-like metal-dependent hydrolase (beta-lactamase superfamily II)